MSEYLEKLDSDYKNAKIQDWDIDDIFLTYKNPNDDIATIVTKYMLNSRSSKSFTVEDVDAQVIKDNYNQSYNILIRSVLNYLLANSKFRSDSKLTENCDEICDLYLKYVLNEDCGLLIHNLSVVIKWTIQKFPSHKKNIHDKLYQAIMNNASNNIEMFFLADYCMRDKELVNLFSKDDYFSIYEKYYVDKTKKEEVDLYLRFYEAYIKYLNKNDKVRKKDFIKKYITFVLNNMELFSDYKNQILLQTTRDYMDEINNYSDEEYYLIDSKLNEVNSRMLSKLETHTFSLPKEREKQFLQMINDESQRYDSLDNEQKIDKLMDNLPLIHLETITKSIEENKNSLSELFTENLLDEEGMVINYKTLKDSELFSLKAGRYIPIFINIYRELHIRVFFKSFKMDNKSIDYIRAIISNNKLVSNEKVDYLAERFISFFNCDYKNSVYDIVSELEESLRFFFKNNGMNIYKKNGSRDFIGLSNIFNDMENNPYRDKLLEIIDDDFYFTLKWFLVDNYGFCLRNKIAHRYKSENLYQATYSIYIVIQIFRLYWGFQND